MFKYLLGFAIFTSYRLCLIAYMAHDQQAPPSGNPYDFILNPQQQPKRSFLSGGPSKLLMIAGGTLLLIIILSIVLSLLFSGGGQAGQLKEIAARQEEIVRVAELGLKEAKSPDGLSLATTVSLSVATDQSKLLGALEKSGIKVEPAELNSKKDAETDELLKNAAANNRYDEALTEILTDQLNDYLKLLRSAHQANPDTDTKTALESSFDNASALLGAE